ncbi:hypothetical protein DUI87_16515 [Hirundo rustica rustica]|uniref:Uncharacterized protein n=1 Tax=Hirundo rustica rustica TaxID=333673 RepID=A0A3M0K3S2_HIRRU|nr:hypothetical protein DUI87_16515 [Hirundo rustica rustica]
MVSSSSFPLSSQNPFCNLTNPLLFPNPSFPLALSQASPPPLTAPSILKAPPSNFAPCRSCLQLLVPMVSLPPLLVSTLQNWGGRNLEPGTRNQDLIPILSATPVTFQRSKRGGVVCGNWDPSSQQTIRDLCKAHKEFGHKSEYFHSLLKANLAGRVAVPFDLQQLFSCLMSSTEFRLWEVAWKKLLRDLLSGFWQDAEMAVDNSNLPISLDHLCGERE